jgi:hypothetical protein
MELKNRPQIQRGGIRNKQKYDIKNHIINRSLIYSFISFRDLIIYIYIFFCK